jgi:glucokinase
MLKHPDYFICSYPPLALKSRDFDDLKEQVSVSVLDIFNANSSVDTVAVSTTGFVDEEGTVLSAGHFSGYSNISWEKILGPLTSQLKRVLTVNDGRASAWAEYIGSDQQVKSFIHFVIGTGIGVELH